MTTWFHLYELVPRTAPNARAGATTRRGALLRIGDGFADLHPWPELGDEPLEEHLASIRAEMPTGLALQSIACALVDGEARAAGYSVFEDIEIPPSHFPVGGLEAELDFELLGLAGFDRIKMKAGRDPLREVERLVAEGPRILNARLQLRIDFNAALGIADLDAFLGALPERLLEQIEFLEDPLPPDPRAWSDIRRRWNIRLAADREKPADQAWDVAVIKPASEGESAIEKARLAGKQIVFTSAMDHPLGQAWAAWNAADFAKKHPALSLPCGLLTHGLYEPTEFSERLTTNGARLLPPGGTGLGFDDLLDPLDWKRL